MIFTKIDDLGIRIEDSRTDFQIRVFSDHVLVTARQDGFCSSRRMTFDNFMFLKAGVFNTSVPSSQAFSALRTSVDSRYSDNLRLSLSYYDPAKNDDNTEYVDFSRELERVEHLFFTKGSGDTISYNAFLQELQRYDERFRWSAEEKTYLRQLRESDSRYEQLIEEFKSSVREERRLLISALHDFTDIFFQKELEYSARLRPSHRI